ncbi:sugar ABC transporter permease [Actinomadura sp. ATCC 31491]|uniref:Sugar ABC transporter permease n=1 Tax=Actinomadura luzonensis TaxID=2805427 RepID=A0ABT0FMI4_9ACTN|nr:sugar ABC transporter permease [Actinomadura luzonensis]MCK2213535.1 sugar ABC transporter permease [Actinomadura luzonensis]
MNRREWAWGYLMIAPLVLGLGVFFLWPVAQSVYYSFTDWTLFGGSTWAGLDNYARLLRDPEVGQALWNTFQVMVLGLLVVPLAVLVAALLNTRGLRGVPVYRTLYFLPVVTMPAAVALIWRWLYSGEYGLINYLLSLAGVSGRSWIADPHTALYAVIVVFIWTYVGYFTVIFLAGLQGIPAHLYEAASIDGAGRVRQFFSITLPLLTPTIFFTSVLMVMYGLQMFDLLYLMFGKGSPAWADNKTIVLLFYTKAFEEGAKGYGAAIAVVLMAVTLAITAVQFRLQRKWVHYA